MGGEEGGDMLGAITGALRHGGMDEKGDGLGLSGRKYIAPQRRIGR